MKSPLFAALAAMLNCNLLHSAPPTAGHAANEHMHKADFEKLVARFEDPERVQWQKPVKVIELLGPLAGRTIADIGAGTGYFVFPIAKQAEKVIAIDIDAHDCCPWQAPPFGLRPILRGSAAGGCIFEAHYCGSSSLRPDGSTPCLLPTPPRGDAVGTVFGGEQSNSTDGTFTRVDARSTGAPRVEA